MKLSNEWRSIVRGWVDNRSKPKDHGFEVTNDIFQFLSEVAWSEEPVRRLATDVIRRRAQERYRDALTDFLFLSVFILLILAGALLPVNPEGELVARPPTRVWLLAGSSGLCLLLSILLYAKFAAYDRPNRLIRALLNAIRDCDAIMQDQFNERKRVSAANRLDLAAGTFYKHYRNSRYSPSRVYARGLKTLAREGSQAILALEMRCSGDVLQIMAVKEDVARILLRIHAGDWRAVAGMGSREDQTLKPSISTRLSQTAENKLIIALIALVTVLIGAVVKVVAK